MKTNLRTLSINPNPSFNPSTISKNGDRPASQIKAATKKKEEPKKTVWHSALFGLVTGLLSFFINVLPEKISGYLSHIFYQIFRAKNPFIPDAE